MELFERLRAVSPTLRKDEPMSAHTTLRLGGPADYFAEPARMDELQGLLSLAHEAGLPITVVGHGSNLLVRDGGIRGLVLHFGAQCAEMGIQGNELICESGVMLSQAAAMAAKHGLAGLAFASGIPGTVGGAAIMNAGAYGGEMSQVVSSVTVVFMDGRVDLFPANELDFGYRASRLQREECMVVQVAFALQPGDPEAIRAQMQELNRRRAEKQPLEYPSAGSTFKRPEGAFAAALIDQCGLKGFSIGGAQVSEKHAGFLLNRGGTAADFLALMDHVAATVERETGYRLEPEVRILGEE